MKSRNVDIFISGAGPAGLLASISFASLGYSVICVDPNKPVTHANDAGADLRTTAFLQPAKHFMQSLDLWAELKSYAVPMEIMRIIDAAGEIGRLGKKQQKIFYHQIFLTFLLDGIYLIGFCAELSLKKQINIVTLN